MRRDMAGLLVYLVLFGSLLVLSLVAAGRSWTLLEVGLPARAVDVSLAVLSAAGLGKTLYHIITF